MSFQILSIVFLFLFLVVPRNSSCVPEFEKCAMPRDCCEGLSCVGGDWQYTTDSTCLSPKSEQLEAQTLTLEERVKLVLQFYQKANAPAKTTEEVERLVMKKYRGNFPKLVAKLEGKYDVEFDIIIEVMEDNKDEL
jgi:hypothetical protein